MSSRYPSPQPMRFSTLELHGSRGSPSSKLEASLMIRCMALHILLLWKPQGQNVAMVLWQQHIVTLYVRFCKFLVLKVLMGPQHDHDEPHFWHSRIGSSEHG